MPNTSIPAAGEAMADNKTTVTDEAVASAMRELEPLVHSLANMSRITDDIAMNMLACGKTEGDAVTFVFDKEDRNALLFAIDDVSRRAREFREQYLSAWDGEVA